MGKGELLVASASEGVGNLVPFCLRPSMMDSIWPPPWERSIARRRVRSDTFFPSPNPLAPREGRLCWSLACSPCDQLPGRVECKGEDESQGRGDSLHSCCPATALLLILLFAGSADRGVIISGTRNRHTRTVSVNIMFSRFLMWTFSFFSNVFFA